MDTVRSFETPAEEMTLHHVGVAVKNIAAALGLAFSREDSPKALELLCDIEEE